MRIGPFELDDLRDALRVIEADAVPRVFEKQKWRLWSYDKLGELYGEPDDWRYEGKVRTAIVGGEARRWMRSRFRLWWKADVERHVGLYFTADCRTGLEWDRQRIAERAKRDGEYLADAARAAAGIQSSFRGHFRDVEKAAERLVTGAQQLHQLGSRKRVIGLE